MDEKIRQLEHQVGPLDEPGKTICPVWIPFEFKHKNSDEPIYVHIRFDLVGGKLPFLIGLPSPKAMVMTFNFTYSNLSLVINQIVFRLDLIHEASPLRLPLVSKCSYTWTFNSRQARTHFFRASQVTKWKQYFTSNATDVNPKSTPRIGSWSKITSTNQETDAPLQSNKLSYYKHLKVLELKNMLIQLGHGTHSQIQELIKGVKKWKPEHSGVIKELILSCAWPLAADPAPHPVCSSSQPPHSNEVAITMEIVYFNNKPLLHGIDSRSKWSETGILRTSQRPNWYIQANTSVSIWPPTIH